MLNTENMLVFKRNLTNFAPQRKVILKNSHKPFDIKNLSI